MGQGNPPLEFDPLKGTCFASYWEDLPPVQKKDNIDDNQKLRIQVRGNSFRSRMSAIRYLIENTSGSSSILRNEPSMLWGTNRVYHWLWAYGAQMDWQQRSGRLRTTRSKMIKSEEEGRKTSATDSVQDDGDWISNDSWWGYMNFGFSIAILAGAVEAYNEASSAQGNSVLLVIEDTESQQLLLTPPMQDCVKAWKRLFEETYPSFQQQLESLEKQRQLSLTALAQLRFDMQYYVWQAHTKVIESLATSSTAVSLAEQLPEPDAKFGKGWTRMVEILAASRFPTDLVTLVEDGAGFLPDQVVTDTYMTQQQQYTTTDEQTTRSFVLASHFRSVQVTHQLADTSGQVVARVAQFWKHVGRNPQVARSMPGRVNRLVHGSLITKVNALVNTLRLFLKP